MITRWVNSISPQLIKLIVGFVLILPLAACGPVVLPVRSVNPVWSPNERLIAYQCYEDGAYSGPGVLTDFAEFLDQAAEICVMDINGQHNMKLTHNNTEDVSPMWSPDGRQIAFVGSDGLYVINSDGTNSRRLVESRWIESPAVWSPDGERLAFSECIREQSAKIFLVDATGENLTPLIDEPGLVSERPVWSTDGLRLAYFSSKGNCDARYVEWGPYRLKVFDIQNKTSKDVLNRVLPNLGNVAWLAANTIFFSFSNPPFPSDADLYVVNINTDATIRHLPGGMKNAGLYAWSHDQASVAYSDVRNNEIYLTPSSFGQSQTIWKAGGTIQALSWSPDDRFLLVVVGYQVHKQVAQQEAEVIWLVSRDGSSATRLTVPCVKASGQSFAPTDC